MQGSEMGSNPTLGALLAAAQQGASHGAAPPPVASAPSATVAATPVSYAGGTVPEDLFEVLGPGAPFSRGEALFGIPRTEEPGAATFEIDGYRIRIESDASGRQISRIWVAAEGDLATMPPVRIPRYDGTLSNRHFGQATFADVVDARYYRPEYCQIWTNIANTHCVSSSGLRCEPSRFSNDFGLDYMNDECGSRTPNGLWIGMAESWNWDYDYEVLREHYFNSVTLCAGSGCR
ncbi:MAG: hypothetical protein GVY13_05720 [Alphaproteobacteria bacterium]|nr:hypothetical protein [Alphaproteobacteria bacterium]